MGPFQMGVAESVLSGITLAALLGMWATLLSFVRRQRRVNEANTKFIRSMQRAEINKYFRLVVEQGMPISPEELSHLDACYESYHESGGNGVGTVMYERIIENSKIVTQVTEGD